MKRRPGRLWWTAAIAVLCIVGLAFWQWQNLARRGIIAAADAFTGMRVSVDRMTLGANRAVFEDVRVTSKRDEPIATIPRLAVAYDLGDWLGGKRLFGLRSVVADSPHVTIVRRRDGTYNVPIPQLQGNRRAGAGPLKLTARVHNGSLDAVDRRPGFNEEGRFYVRDLNVDADIVSAARSHYTASLRYGERTDRLFSIDGRGDIDPPDGYVDQRWTARELPIAAAIDFVAGSRSLRFLRGTLRDVDARYFGLPDARGALRDRFAASASLSGARIAVAGLSKPVDDVRGPVDVYDDGLLTPRLDASLAGTPVTIGGGIYGLGSPRLRMTVRGSADAAVLRTAFTQAARLPIRGQLSFALLVEGSASKPVTWIALESRRLSYAAATLESVDGFVAFDGREADVLGVHGAYDAADLNARGRVAFERRPGAVDMMLGVRAGPGRIPYAGSFLPGMRLQAAALATADDPKAIALHGALWGASASQRLHALFNVDERGVGTVGPLYYEGANGSLYARVALDRPRRSSLGIAEARGLVIPPARATFDGTIFGEQLRTRIGAGLVGRLRTPLGTANARADLALANGELRGAVFGDVAGEASFGAALSGPLQSPRVAGTIVVAGGRYRDFSVNGNAGLAYADGTLRVHDAAVAVGPLFAGVAGTIAGLTAAGDANAARYDLAAQVHSSDVAGLLASVYPRAPWPVQGSVDADVRVRGVGTAPSFSGTIAAPEGSVNGLAFRDLRGGVSGDARALSLTGGRVVVGSTAIALHGDATAHSANVGITAPQTNLADFNDFFDTGDTFAGTGTLALRATLAGTHVVASTGDARFSDAHFRRLVFGTVAARWATARGTIDSALRFGGPTGQVDAAGSVTPATMAVNLRAYARAVDLSTWLPMLGLSAPITGRLDAQTAVSGRYPDIALSLHAAVFGGTVGRMSVSLFDVSVAAAHGRGTLQSARIDLPSLSTTATGSFGLRQTDALALEVHSTSPDFGAFAFAATGKKAPVTGALDSTLRIQGTRAAPRLIDTLALRSIRYRGLTIPRIAAEIDADRHAVTVRGGEVDLERGKVLASATVPIRVAPRNVRPGSGPIAASLRADDVEVSNFLALLPKDTKATGRIDGEVVARGTVGLPQLNGTLSLRDATFSGPMERSPITGIAGDLSLAGSRAQLTSHATVGGGAVSAQAAAALASLRSAKESTVSARLTASNARLDMPGYFQGVLDADVALARTAPENPAATGSVTVSNARIPLDAFLKQQTGGQGSGLPTVAFNNVRIAAGPNVRVQSRNVDIGAKGDITLAGTLSAPKLAGSFRSTGGSLSFYRNFNVESGIVTFDPNSGVIPDVDAVATTFVSDPPTAIRLNVTGPATHMNLALASDPSYSRQQILGMLVGAQQFGAVRGVRSSGGSFSAGSAAANVALGQLSTVFTRTMLEPLSSSLAGTLGFNEVRITSDIQTGVGVSAVKAFGKYVNAIFAQTFGYPRTQSITLEAHPNPSTGLRATAFTAQGPTLLALQQPAPIGMDIMNLNPLTQLPPLTGTNGVTFSFQVKFP
ncbi:MAG TPA: translocation/assembly module TamB domain-containing protein [Candidatus Binatia bacterium]|nr:translocation/assembly module TamB domain-containing protein [Candidatus Binatia bacterium]